MLSKKIVVSESLIYIYNYIYIHIYISDIQSNWTDPNGDPYSKYGWFKDK